MDAKGKFSWQAGGARSLKSMPSLHSRLLATGVARGEAERIIYLHESSVKMVTSPQIFCFAPHSFQFFFQFQLSMGTCLNPWTSERAAVARSCEYTVFRRSPIESPGRRTSELAGVPLQYNGDSARDFRRENCLRRSIQ